MPTQVMIVGSGPVGLAMAVELVRFGVSVRIIDRAAARSEKSKALVLWSRTLELMDRGGCGSKLVDAGLKVHAADLITGDKAIGQIKLNGLPSAHAYALFLPQNETERILEEHLNSLGVQVERGVELLRFAAGDAEVSSTIQLANGQEETITTPWLIGCDGAHSTVRHALGKQFEGDTRPGDWLLADVHLEGVPIQPDELAIFWHRDGFFALFPIQPPRYRVIADLGEAASDEKRPDPTLEEVQAILDDRGPGGIRASDPIWLAAFRINERKVADYRAGRVFLAGDAAHVHSPAGGQGMNTGMQDACNLAWKLALVEKKLAQPEPILSSYSTERSEIGKQVLADSGRLTNVAVIKGAATQAVRNHLASLLFGLSPVRRTMANKLSELSIGYPQSPLTQTGRHWHYAPAAGERAPVRAGQTPVGAGDSPRFALFAAPDANLSALLSGYRNVLEPELREPFARDGLWLVRPDGYVALVAGKGDWIEVDRYFQRVLGSV